MSWTVFAIAIFNAMLINNVILAQFLGVCPFLGVSKKSNKVTIVPNENLIKIFLKKERTIN